MLFLSFLLGAGEIGERGGVDGGLLVLQVIVCMAWLIIGAEW